MRCYTPCHWDKVMMYERNSDRVVKKRSVSRRGRQPLTTSTTVYKFEKYKNVNISLHKSVLKDLLGNMENLQK